MVRARLTEEDDTIEPKAQWPSPVNCHACFYNETLSDWGLGQLSPSKQAAQYNSVASEVSAKHLVSALEAPAVPVVAFVFMYSASNLWTLVG